VNYKEFGKTGWKVSEIGFGAWGISGMWGEQDDNESIRTLHKAIDMGVNFFDTAALYGEGRSERIIAKILKERNERIYITTKAQPLPEDYTLAPWPPSPYCIAEERYPEDYIRKNVEERLKNLEVEALDVLLLHTWTRAWNKNPTPLKTLEKLKKEGKILYYGISTAEHDQNCLNALLREELIDVIEVAFNIFEQDPAGETLPTAKEHNTGVIGRVAFDEGSLTGKYNENFVFEESDWRNAYFSGDRLKRTVRRVEKVKESIKDFLEESGLSLAEVALKFILQQSAISTVIPGMRKVWQVESNVSVSGKDPLPDEVIEILHSHNWNKGFWYLG
jgi:aryl-alcohol dehydrogenase-like predicted oxidoreductase